jgi:hypothetical protein
MKNIILIAFFYWFSSQTTQVFAVSGTITTIYNSKTTLPQDTTRSKYRLSDDDEREVYYLYRKAKRNITTGLWLFLGSSISFGIAFFPALYYGLIGFKHIRKAKDMIADYPEDDQLAQLIDKQYKLAMVMCVLGVISLALLLSLILSAGNSRFVAGFFAGLIYLLMEFTFFDTKKFFK